MCILAEYCRMCVLKCLFVCLCVSVCVSRGFKGCQRQHPASQHAVGPPLPPPSPPLSLALSLYSSIPSVFLILLFLHSLSLSLSPPLFLSLSSTFLLITHSLRAKQTHYNPAAHAHRLQTRHTLRKIKLAQL